MASSVMQLQIFIQIENGTLFYMLPVRFLYVVYGSDYCLGFLTVQVVRELVKSTTAFRVVALSATPGSDIKVGIALN
jgi:hypothetical protein